MNCLKVADIYAYLDEDLTLAQRGNIERHLSSCPKCREAVEERRFFAEVAATLPDLELPPGFTERVMAKIRPVRRHFLVWLAAGMTGLSSLIIFLVFVTLSGEKNLLVLLGSLNHTFWGYAKNAAVFLAKLVALVSFAGKALNSLAQSLSKGLSLLLTLVSPEAQVLISTLALVLLVTLFYVLRKRLMMGEKI